jgi:hypothetical protein
MHWLVGKWYSGISISSFYVSIRGEMREKRLGLLEVF